MGDPLTSVGSYRLGRELGRGANGVVYEGIDDRLGRRVALKVLHDSVSETAEQRARFTREAQILASINHPHVAGVYGVEEEHGRVWIALEFLGGESLADELKRGPLSIEDALEVGRQVADGLEAAHEHGAIHRDLKPANLKRTEDGTVKVLDFGLAKRSAKASAVDPDLSSEGLALGTPIYMSPEHLRGRAVDRRADIWSFGCVLWELLSAHRPFRGETMADVIHAILETQPDIGELPAATPQRVKDLLLRCLHKDPRSRLRDIGDARLELERALDERAWSRPAREHDQLSARKPASRGLRASFATVAVLLAGAGGLWLGPRVGGTARDEPRVLRLTLGTQKGVKRTYPRVSPDGSALFYDVAGEGGPNSRQLHMRRLDSFTDSPIPGTERVGTYTFSPDGERLAVVRVSEASTSRHELFIVQTDGSIPPRFLGRLPQNLTDTGGVAWLDDGRIALTTRPRGLLLIDSTGAEKPYEVEVQCDEAVWPHSPRVVGALPGTGTLLASSSRQDERGVTDCIVALDVETGEQTLLIEKTSCAQWLPSGCLLYTQADVLLGVGFDPESLAMTTEPKVLARGLRSSLAWMSALFHASKDGTIAWWPGGALGSSRRLSLIDGIQPPEAWSSEGYALEGFLYVERTGTFLTSVIVGPSGSYEIWGSEIAEPRMRMLLAEPSFDYMGACVSLSNGSLISCRFGANGAELRRTRLDAPDAGELLYADATEGLSMASPRFFDADQRVSLVALTADTKQFLTFDLTEEPPLAPEHRFEAPRSTRQMQASPDGRWLLVANRETPLELRRLEEGGMVGPAQVVPTAGHDVIGAWWATDSGSSPYRLHLMPHGSPSVHEVEIREIDGELEFSTVRPIVRLREGQFRDAVHVGADLYLGIIMAPDEIDDDRINLLIGGLRELSED